MQATNILSGFTFRCSSLGHIMTDARAIAEHLITPEVAEIQKKRTRTDEEKAVLQKLLDMSLSAGAKTFIEGIAKEFCYGFHELVNTKHMEKGKIVEDESIALYNRVFFTDLKKNTERRKNEWIEGECDIFAEAPRRKITDIKSAWNMATFPATAAQGYDALYEWQVRGYMMLWDAELAELAYTLISTPDELVTKYEQADLHYVDHIPDEMRVTLVPFTRDLALEEKIKVKVEAARRYLNETVAAINAEHLHGAEAEAEAEAE